MGRMQRLDGKIKELQDAVTSAHDTSQAFNSEVMTEHRIFHLAKEQELKDVLATHADGQIELYEDWLGCLISSFRSWSGSELRERDAMTVMTCIEIGCDCLEKELHLLFLFDRRCKPPSLPLVVHPTMPLLHPCPTRLATLCDATVPAVGTELNCHFVFVPNGLQPHEHNEGTWLKHGLPA